MNENKLVTMMATILPQMIMSGVATPNEKAANSRITQQSATVVFVTVCHLAHLRRFLANSHVMKLGLNHSSMLSTS